MAESKSEWRTGGPGSPWEPGAGDKAATVPARPGILKRFWQWLKDQQGPAI